MDGAVERIMAAGSNKVAAVHRGFSGSTKNKFRNPPMWEIPIEIKRLMPGVPILCDPSHMCGNRYFLQEVSQKAMDLSYDGLMIESHIDPNHALSDSEQQLTPKELDKLLENLVLRKHETDNVLINVAMKEWRDKIDQLDEELISITSQRMNIVKEIANHKKENNLTILQEGRWAQMIESRRQSAEALGLPPELFLKIFEHLHQESIRMQTEIMNSVELADKV